jgi:TetR/AcrR family transcriptional regulator, cholesterol catabolism regulator
MSAGGTTPRTPRKSARTRTRILDAAAQVLSLKGYAGTRLADVAEAAQLQAPAIYYYFSSREDLIAEVMRTGVLRAQQHVKEALDALPPQASPLDRICAAVEAHLRIVLEQSDYATAAIRNFGQLPPQLRQWLLQAHNAYGALWRRLLTEARQAGELREDVDPRAARMLILGALNWAPEWWNPRRGSLDAVIRTAQSIVRNGLAANHTPRDNQRPLNRR